MKPLSLALVGAGRLATSIGLALHAKGQPPRVVASRSTRSANVLAQRINAAACTLEQAVAAADLVLLTVPDDAIECVAAELPWRPGQAVVHCSGATEVDALAAAADKGALVGAFHPLQIFSDPERGAVMMEGSSVTIEADEPLLGQLVGLARVLGLRPLHLPMGARAAYHGAANYAASFLLSMLDEAIQVWEAVGLPREEALQALLPLARGTLSAAQTKGLAGALSGAVSRGDAGVVRRHLQALDALGGEHGSFYRELSRRQLELARAAGRLDDEALERLRALLT
ncbi:MAG: DUF2520 domain-containing protein [Paucibacter sp.]|nr:DUF2520 domain-containing protein [Roseateles sp.]